MSRRLSVLGMELLTHAAFVEAAGVIGSEAAPARRRTGNIAE